MNKQNTIWVILGLVVVVIALMWFSGTFFPVTQPQAAFSLPDSSFPEGGITVTGGTRTSSCPVGQHRERGFPDITFGGTKYVCVPDVPPECEQSPSGSLRSESDNGVIAFLSGTKRTSIFRKPRACYCTGLIATRGGRTGEGSLTSNNDYLAAAATRKARSTGRTFSGYCKPIPYRRPGKSPSSRGY